MAQVVAQQERIHPMRRIRIAKVVLNIGVGKSGEPLERAKRVLTDLTGSAPNARRSRRTIRDFGVHRGEPIGVTVTLRGSRARDILKRLLATKENRLSRRSFDATGTCSFGIREHIEISGVRYSPEIGIFGLDVSVVLERPGFRVQRRRRAPSLVGKSHRITPDDAVRFFQQELGVEVA